MYRQFGLVLRDIRGVGWVAMAVDYEQRRYVICNKHRCGCRGCYDWQPPVSGVLHLHCLHYTRSTAPQCHNLLHVPPNQHHYHNMTILRFCPAHSACASAAGASGVCASRQDPAEGGCNTRPVGGCAPGRSKGLRRGTPRCA